jgi:diamine N-acetyltransferase
MIIQGEKVVLRPMTVEEMPILYQWATQSEATPYWYGEHTGEFIPSYEEFFTKEFKRYYFDGSQPEKGRAFAILIDNRAIGEVNYNEINRENNSVDIDIIIAEDTDKNKGYGTDALKTLAKYLFQKMDVQLCYVDTAAKNHRAIRACEKAGFKRTKTFIEDGVEWQRLEIRNLE